MERLIINNVGFEMSDRRHAQLYASGAIEPDGEGDWQLSKDRTHFTSEEVGWLLTMGDE